LSPAALSVPFTAFDVVAPLPPHPHSIGAKFEHELHHVLTRATAFEAVMRVRATRGIRFSNFYGNYFIRGTDLLALPNCTADSSFSLDMAYDEAVLSAQAVTIQVRLLMFCCGWYIFADTVDRVDAFHDSSSLDTLLRPLIRLPTPSVSVLGGAAVHLGRRGAQDPRAHHGHPCHRGKQTRTPLLCFRFVTQMASRVLVFASCYAFCAYLSLCAYSHDLCI
jgi:hypothetical protein